MRFLQNVVLLCCLCPAITAVGQEDTPERPNMLVVMVDDMGFSDLGCYGSEIETPNLDALAAHGLRFSQFYNTAKCHSSRISLLTGRYAFQAGNTSLSRAVTSAEVLGQAGYFTAMTGKWHLQEEPTDFGFDRYFGHLSGACNYYRGDNTFRLNGAAWKAPTDGSFYTTVADVDYALQFLGEARETSKPWYLYVAFNAPHAPLQPLKADYEKYMGRYDAGWDAVRKARVEKQAEIGLFGHRVVPSPRPEHIPAWDSLSEPRRRFEARRMAAYAGMIDRVDQELGRLFADLRKAGEMENTLILFVSDNGACPYDRRSNNIDGFPYDPDTMWSDSTGWAWARNTPFRFYKQNQFEGGIATAAIAHWPAGLKTKAGSIVDQPVHLVDVLPTLADLAGADLPAEWPGRELEPVAGISLLPILQGRPLEPRPPIHLLFGTDRGLRDGDWKLVSFRSLPWELYNIREDRTELHNVAALHPELVQSMAAQWRDMSEHVLKAPSRAYEPVKTEPAPAIHPEWTDFDHDPAEQPARNSSRSPAAAGHIRARKDTRIQQDGGMLILSCTGTDSGLALDRVGELASDGPYSLVFQLQATAGETGEMFFTTDAGTKLPSGHRVAFPIQQDEEWHSVELPLATKQRVYAIRLDPGDRPGEACIRDLMLKDGSGKILKRWPQADGK